MGGFWEPRLSYFLIFSPVPGLSGTLRAKQQSCGFFPFPVATLAQQLEKGEALTLACVPTSCWYYWSHWPASTPKQSWGLGKSKKSTGDLLALGLMGLLSSQAPLTILVGLRRWWREGILGGYRVRLLLDKALGSRICVLAFLSQSPTYKVF